MIMPIVRIFQFVQQQAAEQLVIGHFPSAQKLFFVPLA